MEKTIHQGRNVKRYRELLGIKQETLAAEMGEDWNQRKISLIEQKEVIEDNILIKVANVLKVPVDAIKNFDEDTAINILSNTFTSHDHSTLNVINHNCTFNPFDKVVELYEALLKSEREKINLLEKFIDGNK
ncbi:helix-turn-helix domain-containing protein [Sediminibacterium salmoneum]|uniref:helix-turn-helix domain-containing protein n=1 Tax=Sediminibacterium salmoneum TaxID=426421 RepID=UPI0004787128|nr:helix-turn-helix transcriptional regulator [Sediminibacterium salmoneum]